MMEMTPVSSSNIESVGYDKKTKTLRIRFKDGSLYEYFDVPEHIHQGLLHPPDGSTGKFFHANVKGVYTYVRL